jgi:hypothetical protein
MRGSNAAMRNMAIEAAVFPALAKNWLLRSLIAASFRNSHRCEQLLAPLIGLKYYMMHQDCLMTVI